MDFKTIPGLFRRAESAGAQAATPLADTTPLWPPPEELRPEEAARRLQAIMEPQIRVQAEAQLEGRKLVETYGERVSGFRKIFEATRAQEGSLTQTPTIQLGRLEDEPSGRRGSVEAKVLALRGHNSRDMEPEDYRVAWIFKVEVTYRPDGEGEAETIEEILTWYGHGSELQGQTWTPMAVENAKTEFGPMLREASSSLSMLQEAALNPELNPQFATATV